MKNKRYKLDITGVYAEGVKTGTMKEFLVFKGSKTFYKDKNFTGGHKNGAGHRRLESLISNGNLIKHSDGSYVLMADTVFSSPSNAACVFNRGNCTDKWVPIVDAAYRETTAKKSVPKSSSERPQKFESEGWVRNKKVADEAKIRAGYRCQTCGLKFEDTYGELGSEFLEVHHLFPVSKREKEETQIIADEIAALCSNCHRMIHRLLSSGEATEENQLETLKSIIEEHKP